MTTKIALITPLNGDSTYTSDTIIDGIIQLKKKGEDVEFFVSTDAYKQDIFPYADYVLQRDIDVLQYYGGGMYLVMQATRLTQ